MTIDELLAQLQRYESRRRQRDYRPEWLRRLISRSAELIEPLESIGRAGYDCRLDEHGWIVSLYLGCTEVIGGPLDGHIEHASFRINLEDLRSLFHSIRQFEWYSLADRGVETQQHGLRCLISIQGAIDAAGEQRVRLEILSVPPADIQPGLHCRPDGTLYET